MVALDLIMPLSPRDGAVRLSLDEAADFASMFREPLLGCCLVNL